MYQNQSEDQILSNNITFNKEEEKEKITKELDKRPYLKKDYLIIRAMPLLNNLSQKSIRWFKRRILYLKFWSELIN